VENALSVVLRVNICPILAMGLAGLPCTIVIGGTDRVTTLPAATTALCRR